MSAGISAGTALAFTSSVIDIGGQKTKVDTGRELSAYTVEKRPSREMSALTLEKRPSVN